jgi:hypothetical protein
MCIYHSFSLLDFTQSTVSSCNLQQNTILYEINLRNSQKKIVINIKTSMIIFTFGYNKYKIVIVNLFINKIMQEIIKQCIE